MRAIALVFVMFSAFVGCARPAISPEKVQEYTQLDIYQFIKTRFVDEEYSGLKKVTDTLDHWNKAMEKTGIMHSTYQGSPASNDRNFGLMQDGKTVIFAAGYTGIIYSQLLRPRLEVMRYCQATEGKFLPLGLESTNFVARFFTAPSTAFVEVMNRTYTGGVTIGTGLPGITITHDMNSLKPFLAQAEAQHVAMRNAALDIKGGVGGYQGALDQGSFGLFACERTEDGQHKWRIAILPFTYYYRDPRNQLSSHELRIIMIPEKFL